jgi:ABC-type glycerol-3-phosphate transport system substrate-binding protein
MRLQRFASRILPLFLVVSLFGQGCAAGPDPAAAKAATKTELVVWNVVDSQDSYDPILTDYHLQHPFVSIAYKRFRLEEYESQLLNALAEDRGPDVFMIHNTWVGKYLPKILPQPASTHVAVMTQQGTLQKTVVPVLVTNPTVSVKNLKNNYADVVSKDFLRYVNVSPTTDKRDMQQRVMGLPVSVDTMALYANKDLMNAAGIPTLPDTWDTFQADVKKLVKLDSNGELLQSGAAIGTSSNVDRAPDLLALLMMQNGAQMVDDSGFPTFQTIPPNLSAVRDVPPAYDALGFYTDFANPSKDVYTWNAQQPDALDAFVQGKTAFYFGYSYDLATIKSRAPKLNLAISPMPQISGNPVANFANYWGWVVSKKTKNSDIAWDFLNFMQQPTEATKYLSLAKRPAALKSLLSAQVEDEDIGVFASQVLTAQSWYRGTDPAAADTTFNDMIDQAASSTSEHYGTIVSGAVEKIGQSVVSLTP